MAKNTGRRTLVTTISVLAVLLIAIGTVALIRIAGSNKDPYRETETSSTSDAEQQEDTPPIEQEAPEPEASSEPTIDPATVSTVDIVPMAITVSYVKGAGAFEYEVLRASNGTRYVEFSSPKLVGTKCTNDKGTFASIIANPTEAETTALAKTTTVEGATYGLSLADSTCTSSSEELQKYQKSFTDAFTLLKKID